MTLTQWIGVGLLTLSLLGVYVTGWRELRRWFR